MKKNVLIFFPHNPFPPMTGGHKRCIEMISGLKEIGCEVTLVSSTVFSETKWDRTSIESLRMNWGLDVRVHKASILDITFTGLLYGAYYCMKKNPPFNSVFYSPPGMRRWFARILHEISPDVVFITYTYWDSLLNHQRFKSVLRIIDTHLVTLDDRMRQALKKHLSSLPIGADEIEDEVLKENFFEKLGLTVHPDEFRIYDRYDYTIVISQIEADIIKQNTHKTKVSLIPMTQEPCYIPNRYTGPALFPTGPNPFNIQGYLYFVKRVLPLVRRRVNSFYLQVTGYCCDHVRPEEGIMLSGFVPDLKAVYELSKFVVCPVFGGTGQQVKIVEAMAHGVPVIALRAAAESSPIRHSVNGLVADNAYEFAEYVIQLWKDEELCRQLGDAARETIAAEFSRSRLIEGLSLIVS
jgi:hypothetical protein